VSVTVITSLSGDKDSGEGDVVISSAYEIDYATSALDHHPTGKALSCILNSVRVMLMSIQSWESNNWK
jgi:hypothetical protein